MGRYGHLGWFGRIRKEDRTKANECLEQDQYVGLCRQTHWESFWWATAKVFLARALAQESAVYLMDEPFAGVDAVTEKTMISILQEMKNAGKTLMVVHHDLASAREYFDQLLLLNMRKGATALLEKYILMNCYKNLWREINRSFRNGHRGG